MKKIELSLGLIRGRHEMPVDGYLFSYIPDVFDFEGMYEKVVQFLQDCYQANYENGAASILVNLYVTGLTAATAAVIKACSDEAVSLNLYHYDRDADTYQCQPIWRFKWESDWSEPN